MKQIAKTGVLFGLFFLFSAVVPADLILYYDFETPDPNFVYDLSEYGNNGRLVADTEAGDPALPLPGPTTKPDWIAGVRGDSALQFCKGVNNYNSVWITKSDSLTDLGGKWAFSLWIRQDSRTTTPGGGGGYPRVISCPNYEIELGVPGKEYDYFWPYEKPQWQVDIGTSYIGGGGSLGQWYHMALVYDGTDLRKYINDQLVANSVKNLPDPLIHDKWGTENWINGRLKLACQTWPFKDWFIGALDDVAIWSYGYLDAEAVQGLYDGTYTPLTVPFIPEPRKTPEAKPAGSFLFNATFINEYPTVRLLPDESRKPWTPWNWLIADNSGQKAHGIRNVSLWDEGDPNIIKYAAFVAPQVELYQVANPAAGAWRPIREGIRYNLKASVAGLNAVGNRVGVRFYKCSQTDPNGVLIADPNETSAVITANQKWVNLSASYISAAADDYAYFKAVAYTKVESGPSNDTWGYFDSIVIEADAPVTCSGVRNLGLLNRADFDQNCRVDLEDLAQAAARWQQSNSPEPRDSATELLSNSDFYQDIALVPGLGDSAADAPSGWAFVPDSADVSKAGLWNVSNVGLINSPGWGDYQPAGGSVAAYIDTETTLEQIASTPISSGTKYYLSAMVAGTPAAYQNIIRVTWEYVDSPTTPTNPVTVAVRDFVAPMDIVWRKLTAEYTAAPAAAGKYFRVTCQNIETASAETEDWALIGYVSIDTVKPAEWPRINLLTNGDFEDVSNLSRVDQFTLLATHDGVVDHLIGDENSDRWAPGWTYGNAMGGEYERGTSNGLQCMLWAPPGQPIQGRITELTTTDLNRHLTGGRISIWLGANEPGVSGPGTQGPVSMIYQKVASPTIEQGKTYYLDFTACSSWSEVNDNPDKWPANDPNITVELYWVAPGQTDLTGTRGTQWDYITRAMTYIDKNLGATGGKWQIGQTRFTADAAQAGKHFFVRAFGSFPYAVFEEIVLSEQPRPTIGAYTCYELRGKYGGGITGDLDGNCVIGVGDLERFAVEWLDCVDPAGCP